MMRLSKLWSGRGRIGRGGYLLAGFVLFAAKFAIDNAVAAALGPGRAWSLIEYLAPGQAIASLLGERPDRAFYLTMTAVALPFVVVGLSLTVQRLRDAGLSMLLVALFFLPLGNLFFFLVLCLLPARRGRPRGEPFMARAALPVVDDWPGEAPPAPVEYGRATDPSLFPRFPLLRHWPADTGNSAALAALLPAPFMVGAVMFATLELGHYGWGLFIGLPFVNGMLSAILHGTRVPRAAGQSAGVGVLGVVASSAGLLVFALEGLGCMVMFLPLAMLVGLIGAALGHAVQARPVRADGTWGVGCCVLGLLPTLMSAEHAVSPPAPRFAVTTSVDVDAPPEAVWAHVVSFGDIPPPAEWIFRTGVAYPVRARIDGSGVGAVRYCEFSTGPFVEPIDVWDRPRLLKFAVTHNPPPMREWSFRSDVHPPHLDNFLVSEGGQFRLTPLPDGRTRVEGTTWYRHNMWPAAYWRLWSDFIIHRIHTRVLEHVKGLSEGAR